MQLAVAKLIFFVATLQVGLGAGLSLRHGHSSGLDVSLHETASDIKAIGNDSHVFTRRPEGTDRHAEAQVAAGNTERQGLETSIHDQCNDLWDLLHDVNMTDFFGRRFGLRPEQYTTAVKKTPSSALNCSTGGCEVVVFMRGSRIFVKNGGSHLSHPVMLVDTFPSLLRSLGEAFPQETVPDFVLHFDSSDTSSCGKERPDIICMSMSESPFNVNTLILPIHPNQRLDVSKNKVEYMRMARAKSEPFASRVQKAVWHGAQSGHANLQLELGKYARYSDSVPTVLDGNHTVRELVVKTAMQHSDYMDASFVRSPMDAWLQYSMVLSLDGHAYAGNTLEALLMGSVMLRHEPLVSFQWYEPLLVPYKHYVPIEYDGSDILDKIKWVRENPSKASRIAENAVKFAELVADKTNTLCYVRYMLRKLSDLQSSTNVLSTFDSHIELHGSDWQSIEKVAEENPL